MAKTARTGWKVQETPRQPHMLGLEDFFGCAAVIGLLSAQLQEPDPDWICEWALDFGETMAKGARRRLAKANGKPKTNGKTKPK